MSFIPVVSMTAQLMPHLSLLAPTLHIHISVDVSHIHLDLSRFVAYYYLVSLSSQGYG